MLFECYPGGWHPYQEQFARAIAPYGVHFRPGDAFSDEALRSRADELDGIHFHWVEYLWTTSRWWNRPRLIWGLRSYCKLAKQLGKRIIWTVHNHTGHEGSKWGDWAGFRVVPRFADLTIVHSEWSEEYVRRKLRPAGEIIHMPLGNFDGYYKLGREPSDVRRALSLSPGVPVVGLVGGVRPYRGHELAIAAAKLLGRRCQLLIAG